MKVLIKIGGSLLEDSETRGALARELAATARQHQLVIVHGGGKQVTRFLEERGVPSRFVAGLRVSDEPVVDAVTKVIAGSLNTQLVAALLAAGERPVGLSGVDGLLTDAVPLDPELGFVGHPANTDGRLLDLLLNSGYLPVVACIAADRQGAVYNVNADQMAVSCALGWHSEKLIFLTDVQGVKDNNGQFLDHLALDQIGAFIDSGAAKGGMRAKLNAADRALRAGLEEVVIASGHLPGICRRLFAGEAVGTRLSSQLVSAKGAAQ